MFRDFTILPGMPGHESLERDSPPSAPSLSSCGYINSAGSFSGSVKKGAAWETPDGRSPPPSPQPVRTERATAGRITAGLVATLLVLLAAGVALTGPAAANTGCPESTSSFGSQSLTGTCTITNTTTWENGTLTIAGDVAVDAPLTLRNMVIVFDPSFNGEFELIVSAALDMQGGGIESTNANHWRVQAFGAPVTIRDGTFRGGTWDLSTAPAFLENNLFENSDARNALDGQHMWIGPNSTVSQNTFTGINVDDGAVMVSYRNYGNILFFGNSIGYSCVAPASLTNCMGIEVISSQVELTPIAPFPAVEIAWNNFTFESIAANTDSNAVDIEFSDRVYVHNNTMRVVHATQLDEVTEFLLSGGARDSVFENNTGFGKPEAGDVYTYCFFQFIYSNANNLWQYNTCDDMERMAILSGTGGTVMAHNTMTNVSSAGFWICYLCAGGSSSGGSNMVLYDNRFTFVDGTADIMWNDIALVDSNTYILNGNGQTSRWGEGTGPPDHTVPGDGNWLYHAQSSIEALRFANESDGDRRVTMTADGGNVYWDTYPGFGATDNAALTITGNIDPSGSANLNDAGSGTFLWELGRDMTDMDVLASGDVTFSVESFFASTTYDIWLDGSLSSSFNTDATGAGSFVVNFGSQRNVVIIGAGQAPPDNSPPTASFTFAPSTPIVDENVTFDASSSSDDFGISSHDWDFGNGEVMQGEVVTYAYDTEGNYSVTLTVWDAAGNSDSTVSIVQVTTPPPQPDTTAPAQVVDLAPVVVNSQYVILQWEAPGDDGSVGQADAYDIRFSTAGALDDANFGAAAPVPVAVPFPAAPGSTERLNVSGLSPATQYWFALRTADEVPNWSLVSNSVNATTLQNATDLDDTPPTVTFTTPAQDEVISGTVVVAVEASDDTSVEGVVILLDGSEAASLSEAPYVWAWATDTASAGPHTLRAEATDPTGNVGSDELQVVVLAPGITPESTPPRVVGLMHDPNAGRFDIQFSERMDRGSVNLALSIDPMIAYQPTWQDDYNLTVTLQEASQPNLVYTLAIDDSAASAGGTPLSEVFAFGFIGMAGTEDAGASPDMWLPISLLLAVGLVAMGGLHMWSRKGSRQMRQSMRELALRLEELNNASQARIYQELSDLEGLVSASVSAAEGRPRQLTQAR